MVRKYHNHRLQTNPWHHEEEPHNNHSYAQKLLINANAAVSSAVRVLPFLVFHLHCYMRLGFLIAYAQNLLINANADVSSEVRVLPFLVFHLHRYMRLGFLIAYAQKLLINAHAGQSSTIFGLSSASLHEIRVSYRICTKASNKCPCRSEFYHFWSFICIATWDLDFLSHMRKTSIKRICRRIYCTWL